MFHDYMYIALDAMNLKQENKILDTLIRNTIWASKSMFYDKKWQFRQLPDNILAHVHDFQRHNISF